MWSTTTIAEKLDAYFLISERNTSIGTELRAGTASFLTLSYLLLVNPQIMAQAGVPHDDAVLATALSAALSCFIIGFGGNLPFGCAPGLGLSAYLTFGLVQAELCTLQEAMTACWWSGIMVLIVSLSGIAGLLMKTVPQAIKLAIVVGMGLLIAMIGMVSVGLIVANPKTLVELGDVFGDTTLQLCLMGILMVASLLYHDVKGAILIGITTLTFIDWTMHQSWPSVIAQVPHYNPNDYLSDVFVIFDPSKALTLLTAVGAFLLICIFDISGVLFGLATLAGLRDENDDIPGSLWAFVASSVGTIVAATCGSTPIIVCVECASGVREGGRTGLTAVVMGFYFTASLFLAPLFGAVPELATAPVLVLVGVMMMPEAAKIDWHNMNDALPAFLTIILMPLTYSITNGMIFGLLASAGFYFTTGQIFTDAKKLPTSCRATGAAAAVEQEPLVDEESHGDTAIKSPGDNYGSF
jgi:AGZA family xanthine/uracil permease-like MFS transporter